MDQFDALVVAGRKVSAPASVILAYLGIAPRYLGFDTAIIVFTSVVVAINLLLLFFFKQSIDSKFDRIDDKVEDGFEEVVDVIEGDRGHEEVEPRTDGGPFNPNEEKLEIELDEPSGGGALGGLVAGGLMGAPFGPGGVILGGLFGGILGNAVEFNNLKKQKQEDLKQYVGEFIQRKSKINIVGWKFKQVVEGGDERGDFWEFQYEDTNQLLHRARLYPERNSLTYLGSERA